MIFIAIPFIIFWYIAPLVVSIVITNLLSRKGVEFAGIKNPTPKRVFWMSVATSLVVWIMAFVVNFALYTEPTSGPASAPGLFENNVREISIFVLGGILGGPLSLAIIKWIYRIKWGKAARIWLFFGIVQILILTLGYYLWMAAYPDPNWISG